MVDINPDNAKQILEGLRNQTNQVAAGAEEFTGQLGKATRQMKDFTDVNDSMVQVAQRMIALYGTGAKAISEFGKGLKPTDAAIAHFTEAVEAAQEAAAAHNLMLNTLAHTIDTLAGKTDEASVKTREAAQASLEAINGVKARNEAIREEHTKTMNHIEQSTKNLLSSFSSMTGVSTKGITSMAGLGSEGGALAGVLGSTAATAIAAVGAVAAAVVASDAYMRTNASKAISSSMVLNPLGGQADLVTIQTAMKTRYLSDFENLMSKEQFTKMSGLVLAGGGPGAKTDEGFRGLMGEMQQADMFLGKEYGTTMQRIIDLQAKFGMSVDQSKKSVSNLTYMFGQGYPYVTLWAQTVFDLQGRLGAVATDAQKLSGVLKYFGDTSATMGGGGQKLGAATAATSQIFDFMKGASLPFQAIMGGALTGGGSGLSSAMAYQRAMMGLGKGGIGEFQDAIPTMLKGILGKLLRPGMSEDKAMFALEQFGFGGESAAMLAKKYVVGGGNIGSMEFTEDEKKKFAEDAKTDATKLQDAITTNTEATTLILKALFNMLLTEFQALIAYTELEIYVITHPFESLGNRGGITEAFNLIDETKRTQLKNEKEQLIKAGITAASGEIGLWKSAENMVNAHYEHIPGEPDAMVKEQEFMAGAKKHGTLLTQGIVKPKSDRSVQLIFDLSGGEMGKLSQALTEAGSVPVFPSAVQQ